jgi:hypothetical protein
MIRSNLVKYLFWPKIKSFLGSLKRLARSSFFLSQSRLRGFNDFFEFPFDISRPMPPSAGQVLVDVANYLNSNQYEYWLAEGTLLGIVRDEALIPHDTDLDFYLLDQKYVEELNRHFISQGFTLGRLLQHGGMVFQMTFYNSESLLLDFLFWERIGDGSLQWIGPEIKGKRIQQSEFFDSFTTINWRGAAVRTFPDYRVWLENLYGENWTIPEQKKSDWTKSIGDLR